MNFDWEGFLRSNMIAYSTKGNNVKAGNIGIHCPFCGDLDKSNHMSIQISTGIWSCWRNRDHHGSHPLKLIQALLGNTVEQAREIERDFDASTSVTPETVASLKERFKKLDDAEPIFALQIPPTFAAMGGHFLHYLSVDRGFDQHARLVANYYNLRCSLTGEWAWRLIIPTIVDGKWIGWQGRTLSERKGTLRYISYPGVALKQHLFNHDRAMAGGDVLVIVEGPFDAMKLDFFGRRYGVRAVAALGLTPTESQLAQIIAPLSSEFGLVVVCFDYHAYSEAIKVADALSFIGARAIDFNYCHFDAFSKVPAKDFGDLPPDAVMEAARKIARMSCNRKMIR